MIFVSFDLKNKNLKAFEGWGRVLRDYYDKKPVEDNLILDYLGYWTDEGKNPKQKTKTKTKI